MGVIQSRTGESLEQTVRRFRRSVEKAGTLRTLRRKQFFQKRSKLKKAAMAAAVKRYKKKLLREDTKRDDIRSGRRGSAANSNRRPQSFAQRGAQGRPSFSRPQQQPEEAKREDTKSV